MARHFAGVELYRACIKYSHKNAEGETVHKVVKYGPYPLARTARGVLTSESKWYKAQHRYVDGWIDVAEIEWNRVEDTLDGS